MTREEWERLEEFRAAAEAEARARQAEREAQAGNPHFQAQAQEAGVRRRGADKG